MTKSQLLCVRCGHSEDDHNWQTGTCSVKEGESPYYPFYKTHCACYAFASPLNAEDAHMARLSNPEYALTRVTDYLAGEVAHMEIERGLCWLASCRLCAQLERRIYDATDAALIIMARRNDMILARSRKAEAK